MAGNIYTNINTFKQSFTLLSIHLWCCNNTHTAATCYVIEVSFTVGQLWYLMLWGKLKVIAITRLASAVEWFLLRAWKNVRVSWILCFVCLAQRRRCVRWTPGIRNSLRPPFYSPIYSAPALATRRNYSYKHTSPINTRGVIYVRRDINFCRRHLQSLKHNHIWILGLWATRENPNSWISVWFRHIKHG